MMSKKDYERAVTIVRRKRSAGRVLLCAAFVEFFQGDNPRFDKERFQDACLKTDS